MDRSWAEFECQTPECVAYERIVFIARNEARHLRWVILRSQIRRKWSKPMCKYFGHKWHSDHIRRPEGRHCDRCGLWDS